jgi:hypothetical protein
MPLSVVFAAASLAAGLWGCTDDYGQFDFGGDAAGGASSGGGSTGGSSAGGSSAGGSSAGGASAGGSGAGGSSAGGSSTGGAGAAGGGGPTASVQCNGQACDVGAGAACCVNESNGKESCHANGSCGGKETSVTCDGPEDCAAGVCCLTQSGVSCQATCDQVVCHFGDDSPCAGAMCEPEGSLPVGVCN